MKEDEKKKNEQDEISEEEIKKLIDELNKQKGPKKVSISLSFLLHKNYLIHLSLSLLVNYVLSAVVFGLAIGIGEPFVLIKFQGFIVAILLLTLTESFIKILLFKYLFKIMIYSFGAINLLVQIVILYFIDLLVPTGFTFIGIHHLIIFSMIFSGLRLVLSTYIRLWFSKEKVIFWR
jgi:uncharacterized membrane protein YvlD (DUF360 family)